MAERIINTTVYQINQATDLKYLVMKETHKKHYNTCCQNIYSASQHAGWIKKTHRYWLEKTANKTMLTEESIGLIRRAIPDTPKDLVDVLHNYKSNSTFPALLIRDLPLPSPLPPTPKIDKRPKKEIMVSEFILILISEILGNTFSYREQSNADLVHQICPIAGNENLPIGINSRARLEFHNDGASHPFPPCHILLYCLKNPKNSHAKTLISPLEKAIELIPKRSQKYVMENNFSFQVDCELKTKKKRITTKQKILTLRNNKLEIRYDLDCIITQNKKEKEVIEDLERAFADSCIECELCPGDLLVINNKQAVHARTSFKPLYDGNDRWLQSAYVTTDNPKKTPGIAYSNRVIRVQGWE